MVFLVITLVSQGLEQTSSNLIIIGQVGDICFEDAYCRTKACINAICSTYSKITLESSIVSPNITTTISGYNFSSGGIISISVVNSIGSTVYGPSNFSLDNNGDFSFEWPVINTVAGLHVIHAVDLNESANNKNTTITVQGPYVLDGRIFDDNNSTVSSQVYLYNESGDLMSSGNGTFVFSLSYGIEYDIKVVPGTTKCGDVTVTQLLNNGNLTGNFLGLSESEDIELDDKDFSVLCGVNPLLQEYDEILVTINHSSTVRKAVWKCSAWNFSNELCNDGEWTKFTGIADGATQTNITLDYGDPGIGIASSCGDGVCYGSEACGNCAVDCGACPDTTVIEQTTIRRSSGGGVMYVYSKDEKNIDLDIFPSYSVELKIKDEFNIIYNLDNYSGSLQERYDDSIKLEIKGKDYTLNENEKLDIDLDKDGEDDIKILLITNADQISYILFERVTEVPSEVKEIIEDKKEQKENMQEKETKESPKITGQVVIETMTSTPVKALLAALIIGAILITLTFLQKEKKKQDTNKKPEIDKKQPKAKRSSSKRKN